MAILHASYSPLTLCDRSHNQSCTKPNWSGHPSHIARHITSRQSSTLVIHHSHFAIRATTSHVQNPTGPGVQATSRDIYGNPRRKLFTTPHFAIRATTGHLQIQPASKPHHPKYQGTSTLNDINSQSLRLAGVRNLWLKVVLIASSSSSSVFVTDWIIRVAANVLGAWFLSASGSGDSIY